MDADKGDFFHLAPPKKGHCQPEYCALSALHVQTGCISPGRQRVADIYYTTHRAFKQCFIKMDKKEPETIRFPAFWAELTGWDSRPSTGLGQRGYDSSPGCHSLPLIQILFSFDDTRQNKKLLISQELCGTVPHL